MRLTATIFCLLALISCRGASQKGLIATERSVKIPQRLDFKEEISGRILAFNLKNPSGLAIDSYGNLYISDTGNHRILKLNRRQGLAREYGGYGSGIGRFHEPEDIVVDRDLNIYIVDSGNRRLIQLDINLNYVDEIVPVDDPEEIITNMGKLSGVQISSLGEITVADYDNSRLIKMDNFNRFSRYIGDFGYGAGALLNPAGIASDDDGRIYTADGGNGRIAVYDDYGNYLYDFGRGELQNPSAIAVSPKNIVWVADRQSGEILAYSADGHLLYSDRQMPGEDHHFSDVEALAISPEGDLYVADSGNNRIMIYRIVYEDSQ